MGIQVSLQDCDFIFFFFFDVYPEAVLLHYMVALAKRHFNEFFHGCDEWM